VFSRNQSGSLWLSVTFSGGPALAVIVAKSEQEELYMKAGNTVKTLIAAAFAVSLGLAGPVSAGDRHHGGYGHGYSGGHGYSQHRGHGGYKRGHRYNRHRGHRGYGRGQGHHYGYRGYSKRYYRDSNDDLLIGLLLGGFAGYALNDGYRH
jgi:hypothetical protein